MILMIEVVSKVPKIAKALAAAILTFIITFLEAQYNITLSEDNVDLLNQVITSGVQSLLVGGVTWAIPNKSVDKGVNKNNDLSDRLGKVE
jgi:hypothetical protein